MTQSTPHRLGIGLLALLAAIRLAACTTPVSPEERVATLEIAELPSLLLPGDTLQLEVVAIDAGGSEVQGAMISWTSSDLAVATVSSSGLVTAGAEGTSTITAAVMAVSDTAGLAVTPGSTSYDVVFESIWSANTHPASFPTNPHFSGLIGGTHGDDVTFWAEGSLASYGIKQMAELGSKTPLDFEVEAAILAGTADGLLSGGGISPSPGNVELTFDVSVDFPLVTLVSMIAPSPDWFVGVSSLSLLEDGSWLSSVVIQLFAYDAGTDGGVIYTSPDEETDPRADISLITVSPFDVASALGTFTFTRQP
jgi:hypothetical protein